MVFHEDGAKNIIAEALKCVCVCVCVRVCVHACMCACALP